MPIQCPSEFINDRTWGTTWPYAPLQTLFHKDLTGYITKHLIHQYSVKISFPRSTMNFSIFLRWIIRRKLYPRQRTNVIFMAMCYYNCFNFVTPSFDKCGIRCNFLDTKFIKAEIRVRNMMQGQYIRQCIWLKLNQQQQKKAKLSAANMIILQNANGKLHPLIFFYFLFLLLLLFLYKLLYPLKKKRKKVGTLVHRKHTKEKSKQK